MRQRCDHALSSPRPFGPWEHLPCGEPTSPRSAQESLPCGPSSRDSQRVALFSAHSLMQDVTNASAL
jgi:hypothetical protein